MIKVQGIDSSRFVAWLIVSLCVLVRPSLGDAKEFITHLGAEPRHLDPVSLIDASGSVLFGNLYHGLYRLSENGALVPGLAERCSWRGNLRLVCRINPLSRYSDGSPVKPEDFIRSWERLINQRSRHAERLLKIRGVKERLAGDSAAPLGLSARQNQDHSDLLIELSDPDPEFIQRLASPALTALKVEPPASPQNFANAITNGPYKINNWTSRTKIELVPNPYFPDAKLRPKVTLLILPDVAPALSLFETNRLSLLRWLPTREIPRWQKRKEFSFHPLLRFDFLGFGPQLVAHEDLRQALASAIDYQQLRSLYHTPGKPGCPGIPRAWASPWPCQALSLARAQQHLKKAKNTADWPQLNLLFSRGTGDEDVARGMEFIQEQWRKHLGLEVPLESAEIGVFLARLQSSPPPIFRRSLMLDRATCAGALEHFVMPQTRAELGPSDPKLNRLLSQMTQSSTPAAGRSACGQALKRLIDKARIIPLGQLHMANLASPDFTGWKVNPLGLVDLTDLRPSSK